MWNDLSMSDKNALMQIYIKNGVTSLDKMKEHYNSYAGGGNLNEPPFVKRYSEGQERAISTPEGNATHKLSYAEADGKYIVYPNVQPVDYNNPNSSLHDYEDNNWTAYNRAVRYNDTLQFNTAKEAEYYTKNYKRVPFTGAMLNNSPKVALDFSKGRYYDKGGSLDKPDNEKPYIPDSEQNYGYLRPVDIIDDRPEYMNGLTAYDWARANSPYYRDNLGARARFIRDVGTKNLTGQSDYIRDVNRLAVIPNAVMLGAGVLSGAAFNPYLWSALGLASGVQNIEDKNYGAAALDIGLTLGAPAAKAVNTVIESTKLGKTLRIASEMNKAVRNTKFNKNVNIPGQVGWAPKQVFHGYHASNEVTFKPDFWYENWARQTHQAPYGIYVAEGTAPTKGFLTKRPYIHNIDVDLDKPMIQIGELSGKSKNSTRNQLERFAQSQGADAIIFQDIADNQMMHQNILKTLNPDTKLTINDKARAVEELNLGQTYREIINPTLADISYKDASFNKDFVRQMLYNNYINGESIFGYPQTIQTGLDDYAIHLLRNRTLNRDIQAIKEDSSLSSSFLGESRIKRLNEVFDKDLPSIKVGKYSGQDYKNAGHENWAGFYDEKNRFISINRDSGYPVHKIQAHEGLHHIDSKHSLTVKQDAALSKAFDDDFNTLPKTKYAPEYLKDYTLMRKERITTNRDARDELLGYKNIPLEKQNQIINQATDDAIFNAVENANGYGQAYIKRLRAENKLTHEKANAFRESMKKVGVITGIIGTGAAATQK